MGYQLILCYRQLGAPTRYIQLDPSKCRDTDWDNSIADGCDCYSRRMHNICCDNCHSHVAKCLNVMGYDNKRSYGMVYLAFWFFFSGKFVSVGAALLTFLPFFVLSTVIILMCVYIKWGGYREAQADARLMMLILLRLQAELEALPSNHDSDVRYSSITSCH